MKRLFAILILSVHLFSSGGYVLFFQYFIHQSECKIVKQIYENKINARQLVQFKIPVHNPDMKDWDDYKHLQGQLQVKNGYYNYVGAKVTRDTMYLVCVANITKTRLTELNLIVAKDFSDTPQGKKAPEQQPVKKVSVAFEYNNPAVEYSFVTFFTDINESLNLSSELLTNPYIESPGKPPNSAC